jgi:intein/homing endonuclease
METKNWTRENLAWAAGLFEGEGCFYARSDGKYSGGNLALYINMTDRDVLQRFLEVIGGGSLAPARLEKGRKNSKPVYRYSLYGDKYCLAVAYALFPFMGERRRAKIGQMVDVWKNARPRQKVGRKPGSRLIRADGRLRVVP